MKLSPRINWMLRGVLALVFAFVLVRTAMAVSVSPLGIYINGRERSSVVTLFNDGTLPEEVNISFAFGYPQSDSLGNLAVALTDTAPAGEPSALGWIRAFPRRVLLQPGQRQAVRILVDPPEDLEDGEYWARVLIKSRGGRPPVEAQSEDGITVVVDVETTLAIPASFRMGDVETGIEITRGEATLAHDTVVATLDLARTGNAAFLGRMQVDVLDAEGDVIGEYEEHLGVYRELRRVARIAVEADRQPASVRVRIDTRRDDLPADGPLPADRVTHTIEIAR